MVTPNNDPTRVNYNYGNPLVQEIDLLMFFTAKGFFLILAVLVFCPGNSPGMEDAWLKYFWPITYIQPIDFTFVSRSAK